MTTYKIIRFKQDGENEVIERGLTLEEAQEHCQRADTQGIDKNGLKWFDGYTQE